MKTCPNCGYVERPKSEMDCFSYEQFHLFWKAYPRKVGKGAAEKIWVKIKADFGLFEKIIGAIEDQRMGETWSKDNGVYIPHPATWLNQRRWEDETVKKWVDPNKAADQARTEAKKQELRDLAEALYAKRNHIQ